MMAPFGGPLAGAGVRRAVLVTVAVVAALVRPSAGLYRDGYEVVETGPGGFFGAVIDESKGTAWFGIDDSPARLVKVDLGTMKVTGKLELRKDEQRLWCLVRHGNFGYMGVETPAGRLVGIDLDKMQRLGYASASSYPLLSGLVAGDYGYFSAGSNPATILRLHVLQMQQGNCADWSACRFEVTMKPGEEAVRTMFTTHDEQHLIVAMYTVPGTIVKFELPSLRRAGHLALQQGEDKVLCGARYGRHGLFGTATSPGKLVKVNLDTMGREAALDLIDGEDRPAAIVVHGKYAFVGFGSAWSEGTSSILKVDPERMARVAAIITGEGQTWLYTGLGYRNYAFFGTRGTSTTRHASILRINTQPTFPGVPVPPQYNDSGADWITANWVREYPEYHNGGAPVIGARVLVRPSDHHDWTAEHVYGYAAPDPAAPKDTIIRVHEGIDRLEDHGFVAQIDALTPETGYKFAVILTNEVGPSHRSRSSFEMRTALSWFAEMLWVAVSGGVLAAIVAMYLMGWYYAPRLDAIAGDCESEEEAGNSLLRSGGKSFAASAHSGPPGPAASGGGSEGAPASGAQIAGRRLATAFSAWLSQPGAPRQLLSCSALVAVGALCSFALQSSFSHFIRSDHPALPYLTKALYSLVFVACSGGVAWAASSVLTALFAREWDLARRVAVGTAVVTWAAMVTSLVVILAWTNSKVSHHAAQMANFLSLVALGGAVAGALAEGGVYVLRSSMHSQQPTTVVLPEFGVSSWLTERL